MTEKIQIILDLLLRLRNLRILLSLKHRGYLVDTGWFKSAEKKISINADGNPIPWYSYPFLSFIENRLKKDFNIFEYGSGNSTIWLAERVHIVKSVEHDLGWFHRVSGSLPPNAEVVFKEPDSDNDYCKEILTSNELYDLVIVDGIERNCCLKFSIERLKEGGVIVLDNSEHPDYKEGTSFLISNGFKKIDFCGIGPVASCRTCTSIFYKEKNCLDI